MEVADNETNVNVSSGSTATIVLNAINLSNNSTGIHGGTIDLANLGFNTFVKGDNLLFKYILGSPTPIDLNNSWAGGSTSGALPNPTSYADWFCMREVGGSCDKRVSITSAEIGCVDCTSPENWPEFCELNPGHPDCYKVPEGGFKGDGGTPLTAIPNPTSGYVQIGGIPQGAGEYTIVDVTGRFISTRTYNDAIFFEFDVSSLPQGMYQVRIKPADPSFDPATVTVVHQ